jgi:geranylgeranyl diphosphate synthase type 3
MVTDKTGGLFRLAVGLLQSFATKMKDVDFVPLVNNLGLYFQIRDDLINLADEEYMKSKSFCEDLTEGKFSYPIIHCIRHGRGCGVDGSGSEGEGENRDGDVSSILQSSTAAQLLSILKQRTEDVDVKRYAQRLMFEAGSLQYTREKCTQLKDQIVQQIADLNGNEPLLRLIEMLDVQVEKIAELHNGGDGGDGGLGRAATPKKFGGGGGEDVTKNLDYT